MNEFNPPTYRYITMSGVYVLRSGAAVLGSVAINIGISGQAFRIQDGSGGPVVANVEPDLSRSLQYNVALRSGLTVVVNNSCDVTIVYQ